MSHWWCDACNVFYAPGPLCPRCDRSGAAVQLGAPPPITEREKQLVAALHECADDLAAELDDRHRNRDRYATIMDRWERDMEPVRRARALLGIETLSGRQESSERSEE